MGLRSTPCVWKLCLYLHFLLGYLVHPTVSFSTRTVNPSVSHSLHAPSVDRFRITNTRTRTRNVPTAPVLQMQLRSKSKDSEDDTDSFHFNLVDPSSLFDIFNPSMYEEIRLDATLASCYILCRFFIYDITTGVKDVPGWQIQDWIDLANVASSCIVLSSLWTVVGLGTGIFSLDGTDRVEHGIKVLVSAVLVGPLWISVEIWNQWPPNDIGRLAYDALHSLPMGMVWDAIATGTLGLACIMILGKTVASNLRY